MEQSSVCFASVRLPCLKFKAAVNTSYQFKHMSLASGLIREGKSSDHLPCPLLEHTRRRQRALRSNAHSRTRTHARTPTFREHISDIIVIVFMFQSDFKCFVLYEAILCSGTGHKDILPRDEVTEVAQQSSGYKFHCLQTLLL
jgi:hypothetical protein